MQALQRHRGSRRASPQPLELSFKHAVLCQSTPASLLPEKRGSWGSAFGKASRQGCSSTPGQGEAPGGAAPRDAPVSPGSPRLPRQGEAPAGTAPLLACLPPPSQQLAGFLSADTGCCSSECAEPSSPSSAPGEEGWAGDAGLHQTRREREQPE